ncbi:hypothetical protein [Streptomyces sp. CBMA123]|uniref:hypothetical protein n=1 Tax=Streptomyces sp. CBMA123 TaxID=1896313 RepID=UPI0016620C50|nr:hypothetical protein [Streptomyces sp. CBMA123]
MEYRRMSPEAKAAFLAKQGLQVSLAGAEEKLSQLDRGHGQHTAVDLGIPTMRGDR